MSYKFEKDKIKSELRSLLKQCEQISQDSKADYIKNMPLDQTVILQKYLYTDEAREKVNEACNKAKNEIKSILDKIYDETNEKIIAPPSSEAINTLTVLKMRNNLTENELKLFVEKYQDNTQVYNLLKEMAVDNDLKLDLPEHPNIITANSLVNYWNNIDFGITGFTAERGDITGVKVSALECELDSILPDEK